MVDAKLVLGMGSKKIWSKGRDGSFNSLDQASLKGPRKEILPQSKKQKWDKYPYKWGEQAFPIKSDGPLAEALIKPDIYTQSQ